MQHPEDIASVKSRIDQELVDIATYLRQVLLGQGKELNACIEHVLKQPGKQLRPRLVLLVAAAQGALTDVARRRAAWVHMFHDGSLVHDDIVDAASYRRGVRTVHTLWDNQTGVLLGDYLLSQLLRMAVAHHDIQFIDTIAEVMQVMVQGEFLQLEKSCQFDIDEPAYFEAIRKKTAKFIAACCTLGALSAGAHPDQAAVWRDLGADLGIAFQIRDDILDLGGFPNIDPGKDIGQDIKARKVTLPLLYALQQTTADNREKMWAILHRPGLDSVRLRPIMSLIEATGAIPHAQSAMYRYRNQAIRLLHTHVAPSVYRDALHELIMCLIC
ncbi:MAG: polyprenyl synthetase family protein [Bacteroidota bacterium]